MPAPPIRIMNPRMVFRVPDRISLGALIMATSPIRAINPMSSAGLLRISLTMNCRTIMTIYSFVVGTDDFNSGSSLAFISLRST
jgi:hypothetical protein